MSTNRPHPSDGLRGAFDRRSATFFVYLSRLPRWVPLVVLPALLIAGLAVPGPGGAVLLLVVAFLLWFTFRAIPARSASHRIVRLAFPFVLVLAAIGKIVGLAPRSGRF